VTVYFQFLELRHKVELHNLTGRVVECPLDETNRPRMSVDPQLRIPPTAGEVEQLFAGWREELATCRKFAPACGGPARPVREDAATAMNCSYCQEPLPAASRRDRRYCNNNCRAWASYWRGRNGGPAPQPWRHEALASEDPALVAAAAHAQQLAEARGWSRTTLRGVLDGLVTVLRGLPSGARVPMSEVRDRPHKDVSRPRLAEVLGDLGLLHDDSTEAVRALIERAAGELAPGFADPARQWLLVLLDGDPARSRGPRPRSMPTPQQRAPSCKSGAAPTTTSGKSPRPTSTPPSSPCPATRA
jgi:hypothetical protein